VVGVNEVPEELVNDNERAIWAPIIRTRGQDAAVAEIQRLRTIQFKEQEAAFWQLEKIEKQWEKMSLRIVRRSLRAPKDDDAARAPPPKKSKSTVRVDEDNSEDDE
jgi:hypothetical protein